MNSLLQSCEKISVLILVFDFKNQSVRTSIEQDGSVWFCLADVCRVLHIKNPRRVAREMLKQEGTMPISERNLHQVKPLQTGIYRKNSQDLSRWASLCGR